MKRKRTKSEIPWLSEAKYWISHEEEKIENLKKGIAFVRYMKNNNLTEEEAAEHFEMNINEFHKWINGRIPPKFLKR